MTDSYGLKEYLGLFGDDYNKIEKALDRAHQIRTFEIELYWKRATYFWAILAVAYAGFFAAQNTGNTFGGVAISYIGLTLGFAWYLVNRGSSRWQQNWEFHVDLLEDSVTGPLYKTIINAREYSVWDLPGAFPISPTRVNAIVSMFATFVWLPLVVKANYDLFLDPKIGQIEAVLNIFLGLGCLAGIVGLILTGRSRKRPGERRIHARTRGYD